MGEKQEFASERLLARLAAAFGAVVITLSALLLSIVGLDNHIYTIAFEIGWASLALGITSIAISIEAYFGRFAEQLTTLLQLRPERRSVWQVAPRILFKGLVIASLIAFLLRLALGPLVVDESMEAILLLASLALPTVLISATGYVVASAIVYSMMRRELEATNSSQTASL